MSGILWGRDGGLTRKQLERLTMREKFSDYLPWVAYDEETGVYLNIDNTAGFLWECSPLCFAGERTVSTLEGFFRFPFPAGSVVQFILYADPHIEPYVKLYAGQKKRENAVIQNTTRTFSSFLLKGVKGLDAIGGIPVRNFRLFVSAKIPMEAHINVKEIREASEELLRGANLHPDIVTPERLLDWQRRLFNDNPSLNNGYYDDRLPIRKQVIFSETLIEKNLSQIRIGQKVFRCVTPKAFPKEIDPLLTNQLVGGFQGIVSDIDQVETPFFITVNVVFQNLKAKLHTKCNLVLQQHSFGSFAPSLARKKNEYLWAVDELEKGTKFFRIIPIIWVFADDEKTATESLTRVKRIWEAAGFIMQEDRGILPVLFLAALPFGLYNLGSNVEHLERDFIAPADAIATFVPVQSDFSGGSKPLMLFVGRKGQLCGLDIFDRHAINQNAFISATSGSGKSFFVNFLSYNYYSADAMVRIIDIGGSYKKLARMFNGRFLDFDEKSGICLNPFGAIVEPTYDLPVIASIVAQMVYSTQNILPSETEMTLIKNAVTWAYEIRGPEADIGTVYEYLSSFPKYATDFDFECPEKKECADDIKAKALTLAFNLQEFAPGGRFGRWFNGKANFDISRDEFVVLELENLRPQKELFNVVTLQVINAVTLDLYHSDRSRPRLIIFDESWQFLKEGAMLRDVIEEGYRRARKYGGSFTIVTQSLLDLQSFGKVGDVIRANSAFKFYLESSDFDRAKALNLIDYDDFTMKLLKTTKSNKPRYSEIFMDTPFGVGVVRLVVDPYSYYVYTSSPEEIAEIESLVSGGLSYEDAIHAMVKKYRSH